MAIFSLEIAGVKSSRFAFNIFLLRKVKVKTQNSILHCSPGQEMLVWHLQVPALPSIDHLPSSIPLTHSQELDEVGEGVDQEGCRGVSPVLGRQSFAAGMRNEPKFTCLLAMVGLGE